MKSYVITFFVLILFFQVNAQIVLDTTYNDLELGAIGEIQLSQAGIKYITLDTNDVIKVYNYDHSIYKVISFPLLNDSLGWGLYYFSDRLFDLDNDIEFLAVRSFDMMTWTMPWVVVFDEYGNIEYDFGTITASSFQGGVLNRYEDAKLFFIDSGLYKIYDLPGTVACFPCLNTKTPIFTNQSNDQSLNVYPNPANNYTNIEYQLPENKTDGEIVIYDQNGKAIRSYKVDKTFNHLRISTDDLRSGEYFFNIKTKNSITKGEKMIIIK